MAKRIATQLRDEIRDWMRSEDIGEYEVTVPVSTLEKWYKWAEKLNAKMRYDGSPAGKRKPKK